MTFAAVAAFFHKRLLLHGDTFLIGCVRLLRIKSTEVPMHKKIRFKFRFQVDDQRPILTIFFEF